MNRVTWKQQLSWRCLVRPVPGRRRNLTVTRRNCTQAAKSYFQPGSSPPIPEYQNPTVQPQVIMLKNEDVKQKSRYGAFLWGMVASPVLLFLLSRGLEAAGILKIEDGSSTEPQSMRRTLPDVFQEALDLSADSEEILSPTEQILVLQRELAQFKLNVSEEVSALKEEYQQVQGLLESSNESQLRIHRALFDLLTTVKDDNVFLDEALLGTRPIILSDQTILPPSKAALIRVLDADGKNKIIVLGVDVDFRDEHKSVSSRFPADCYELDQWVSSLADDLEKENGNSESGLAIYIYSNRVIVDVKHEIGSVWMTRYRQSAFSPGFPLRQMKNMECVQRKSGIVTNHRMHKDKDTRKAADKEPPPKVP